MNKHPIDEAVKHMSKKDIEIMNHLMEVCGETDESLYAALPTPQAAALLDRNYNAKQVNKVKSK